MKGYGYANSYNIDSCFGGGVFTDVDAEAYYNQLVIANAGLDIDAVALYGISLDALKLAINTLFVSLKVDGTWGQMLYQYWFVGGTASTHAVNAKKLVQDLVYTGSPTQDATGLVLNGTTQYASSNNDPSLENDINSNHQLLFCTPLTTQFSMGSRNNSNQGWYFRQLSNPLRQFVSWATAASGMVSLAIGTNLNKVHIGSRISAVRSDIYNNGISIGFITAISGTLTTIPTCIGAWDNLGTPIGFTQGNIKACTFGDGLTAGQALTATNAIEAFNTTLGR